MATSNPKDTISAIAKADYSDSQYRFVVVDETTATYVVRASSSVADPIFGVLQNEPELGQDACVITGGISKIKLADTVTANDPITTDTIGRGIKATAEGTDYIAGYIVQGGVTGDIGTVKLNPALY